MCSADLMMIRIGAGHPDGDPCRVHNALSFPSNASGVGSPGNKTAAACISSGFVVREGFGFEASGASHIGQVWLARAPWLTSTARLLLTRMTGFVPDAWREIITMIGGRKSQLCHRFLQRVKDQKTGRQMFARGWRTLLCEPRQARPDLSSATSTANEHWRRTKRLDPTGLSRPCASALSFLGNRARCSRAAGAIAPWLPPSSA